MAGQQIARQPRLRVMANDRALLSAQQQFDRDQRFRAVAAEQGALQLVER